MADKDKTVVVKPAKKTKAGKPKTEEPKVEEPKVEEPAVSPAAPTAGAATPAGTDQMGRQLYNVICAECGKETQVPFKPIGDRPVYCRDCYLKKRGAAPEGGMRRSRGR